MGFNFKLAPRSKSVLDAVPFRNSRATTAQNGRAREVLLSAGVHADAWPFVHERAKEKCGQFRRRGKCSKINSYTTVGV